MATAFPMIPGAAQNLSLTLASGDALDVREFVVDEGLSRPFEVDLVAVSPDPDVDFEAAIGKAATFTINRGSIAAPQGRWWEGVCTRMDQTKVETDGVSTYAVSIAPSLWLLGHRRNYRVFQDESELDIVLELLGEWGIEPRLELAPGTYAPRRYRTQYAESDLAFVSRLLEDIGVTYFFEQSERGKTGLVLADAPNRRSPRSPLRFMSEPENQKLGEEYVTRVRTTRVVKPGKYTQSDVDYRKALDYPLAASSSKGVDAESRLERYHHNYGSFLWKGAGGSETPSADDRGAARTDESRGAEQVRRRLDAQRVEGRGCSFQTTAYDLSPGMVMVIVDHPRREIGAPLLVSSGVLRGSATGEWTHHVDTRYTDVDYRPTLGTTKPRTAGIESAFVTGPSGEEIHTDEFGRVRVKFHWDRAGANDETSSCWVPVSQPWAGAGFGGINLPRVGQEVIVDFLGGDPDRPVVVGRVFTTTTPPPYQLPKHKMVSGMRSESYPRPKTGSGNLRMGGGAGGTATTTQAGTPIGSNDNNIPYAVRPAGGGPPVATMGQAGETGLIGSDFIGPTMPGMFGAPQASQELLDQAIQQVSGGGPDGVDGTRSANAVTTDDTAGKEILYLQGQKDIRLVAKNNFSGAIGGNRVFTVLGNDSENITHYQSTTVGKDRSVKVTGMQTHEITGDIHCDGKSNHTVTTKMDYLSQTTEGGHTFVAKTKIVLTCGASTIWMMPDGIVINAELVFINPGDFMMSMLGNGRTVSEAAALAAAEATMWARAALDAAKLMGQGRSWGKDALGEYLTNRSEGLIMKGQFTPAFRESATLLGLDYNDPNDMIPYMWRVWNKMDELEMEQ